MNTLSANKNLFIKNYNDKSDSVALKYARSLKQDGQFKLASKEFVNFIDAYQGEDKDIVTKIVENEIKGCEKALTWKEEKSRYTVEAFKPANDRKADDFSPMWSDRKKKTIMFTSDRSEGAYSKEDYIRTLRGHSDVWFVKKGGGRSRGSSEKWSKPALVENLNTKYKGRKHSPTYFFIFTLRFAFFLCPIVF